MIEPSEGWYLHAHDTLVVIATTAGLRRLRDLATRAAAPGEHGVSTAATGLNDQPGIGPFGGPPGA